MLNGWKMGAQTEGRAASEPPRERYHKDSALARGRVRGGLAERLEERAH